MVGSSRQHGDGDDYPALVSDPGHGPRWQVRVMVPPHREITIRTDPVLHVIGLDPGLSRVGLLQADRHDGGDLDIDVAGEVFALECLQHQALIHVTHRISLHALLPSPVTHT